MNVQVIDSHTGGEPTRLVIAGGPDLGTGSMRERLHIFRRDHDRFRSAVVNEPRGSDAMVGALLCEPVDPSSSAGVVFFNNVGFLGMCGHGAIGLVASLAYLKRVAPGSHRIETPVGSVAAELHYSGEVTVTNVPSYRHLAAVTVTLDGALDGQRSVTGDVAWGGNWFFLVNQSHLPVDLAHVEPLTVFASNIRDALKQSGVTGKDGAEIDHIELFDNRGRNFVLCPGKAYDRSPCGTGTSAKAACLFADGKLQPGDVWSQEGIAGTRFEASVRVENDLIYPLIKGAAFITAEAQLILDPRDPFRWGIT